MLFLVILLSYVAAEKTIRLEIQVKTPYMYHPKVFDLVNRAFSVEVGSEGIAFR